MKPPKIERRIASASTEDLERWHTNLTTALEAPCPPDETQRRWDEDAALVTALIAAITTELDERRRIDDTDDEAAGEHRAAV